MRVIRNERPIPIDVDGTLIIHTNDFTNICPLETVEVYDPLSGSNIKLRKNLPMIRLLKEEHARGTFTLVWSRGGYQWASDIIEALGLTDYVDLVMTKPLVYFDDINIEDWLKDRVWIGPDTIYKHIPKGE